MKKLHAVSPVCETLKRPGVAKAEYAERMAKTHFLTKCNKCDLYHLWVPMNADQATKYTEIAQRVRLDGYQEISPNQYVPIQRKVKIISG